MMRVIAGTARGKNLQALPGEDITRPTINRVKEAMFSSVQFLVPGARVLDLFAGSGQLGIEALSRGAKSCIFVDCSAEALAIVKANCKTAGVDRQSDVLSLIHIYGIEAEFYQSEYAQYWQDAMFGTPELDDFHPDVIYIHTNWRNLTALPTTSDSAEAIDAMLNEQYAHFETMWPVSYTHLIARR